LLFDRAAVVDTVLPFAVAEAVLPFVAAELNAVADKSTRDKAKMAALAVAAVELGSSACFLLPTCASALDRRLATVDQAARRFSGAIDGSVASSK
jgi:hypothetical protein